MKTSALPPGRRLNGRKPAHGARAGERERRARASIRVDGDGVDREERRTRSPASVAASPSMLSSRLNAFVIPTSQRIASGHATTCVWISCDAGAGREHDHRGRELRASFSERRAARAGRRRGPATKSSDDRRRRCRRAARSPGSRPTSDREPEPDGEPDEDADAAEERGRDVVPAVASRGRRRAPLRAASRGGAQIASADAGKSGERREGAHECARVERSVLGPCLPRGVPTLLAGR